MKIVSITAQKPHSTGSGIYLTELVNSWNRQGHEQAVVAGVYREDQVSFPEKINFYPVFYNSERLPYPILGMSDTMPYKSTRYRDLTEEQAEQFKSAFHQAVAKAVEELDPDVIFCHHLYFLAALVRQWFPDRKVFAISHGTDLRQLSQISFQGQFIREQIGKMDGILSLHAAQKQELHRVFSCPEDKITIVGAGYNSAIFHPVEVVTERKNQIVFAGKVCGKKGIFSLIRALNQLSNRDDLQVKVAGGYNEASEYERIQQAAKDCRIPITFLGPIPQTELANLFRESRVFVLPSFFEGLALVTLEAMACGCRVVCSDIPGMASWYDENVPNHWAEFVPMPSMRNVDEPEEAELPAFESRLAAALDKQLNASSDQKPDLSGATWDGIGRKILFTMSK